jgi:integrase
LGLVTEFLDAKKNVIRKTSRHRYKNYLEPLCQYFNDVFPSVSGDVRLIEPKYLRKFIDDSLEGDTPTGRKWSKRTANDAINIIRSLFNYAIDSEYLTKSPAAKLQTLKVSSTGKADFFSDDELRAIWSKLEPQWVDPLKFIALTGLRKAELINLRWENVDLTEGQEQITIESYDDWETKSGNSRIVPLNAEATAIVAKQKTKHPTYVFTNAANNKIHPDRIYQALKRCLADLKFEGDVHKLRHTFASKLAMSGVELVTIKDLLGHTDLQTTQIYAHVSGEHVRAAVNKLELGVPQAADQPQTDQEAKQN